MTSSYGAHAVISTAGTPTAYALAPKLLRNLGILVCVGLSSENLQISPFEIVVRGLRVIGSSVGTAREMDELLDLATKGTVMPIVQVFDFEVIDEVLKRLARSQITGRVVLRIPQ